MVLATRAVREIALPPRQSRSARRSSIEAASGVRRQALTPPAAESSPSLACRQEAKVRADKTASRILEDGVPEAPSITRPAAGAPR